MGTKRRAVGAAIALVAAFALVACGGDDGNGGGAGSPEPAGDGDTGGGAAADITISGLAFQPSALDVEAGATITIANEDGPTHTFTADDGSFDEELASGDSVDVTIEGASGDELGFHCEIHPSMTGTLTIG